LDILTELINRVRAVVLSGKVDINLHWRSLEDGALGSQWMRFLTLASRGTWIRGWKQSYSLSFSPCSWLGVEKLKIKKQFLF
jgi:hypothetical protein